MGSLLFSPTGRIGPGAYLKGAIILGVIGALLAATGYINLLVFSFAVLISFLLVIPFILMSIKRAHDAGKTGWMSLLFVAIAGIVYFGISTLLSLVGLAPSMAEQKEGQEIMKEAQSSGDIQEMLSVMSDVVGPLILPTILVMLLTPIVAAFLVNLVMKSDGHDNQYGPATTGDS
jgi:uncharacterized membrane protein YhaH (DUF805 family)